MAVKGFDVVEKAVKKSFDQIGKVTGSSPQSDVRLYENLTPDVFNVIAETYGPDKLAEYVTAMEVKRMKGMTNGN